MDSVITNESECRLLQLVIWIETVFEKQSTVTVQVGSRAPLIQYDYVPASKIYFYSVASKDELPVFLVAYNSLKLPIDASRYSESTISKIEGEDMTLNFVYNFVKSMKSLQQKYCTIKQDQDKYARGQGISNFIRAESQFVSLFQRNQEIEEIKVAEIEQQKYEKYISNEIIKLQRNKIDLKTIIILVVVFYIFGFLFQAIQEGAKEGSSKRGKRPVKRKIGKGEKFKVFKYSMR